MPWKVKKNAAGCPPGKPYGVVKEGETKAEYCHKTRKAAQDQVDALYAEEAAALREPDPAPRTAAEITADVFGVDAMVHDVLVDASTEDWESAADDTEVVADDTNDSIQAVLAAGAPAVVDALTGEVIEESDGGTLVPWNGVMVIEGERTGDGRQFAAGSLTWPDPLETPMALQWQKETTHGGINDRVVNVGRILGIERVNDEIRGHGVIDTATEDGAELARILGSEGERGVSIVADDPENGDIEFVFPEGCDHEMTADDEVPEELDMRCFFPETTIFHSGRIRVLTVVDVAAFARAKIRLSTLSEGDGEVAAADALALAAHELGAVGSHSTSTSDGPWDASANTGRLPKPLTVSKAKSVYAWVDASQANDGELPKSAAKFPHHEVSSDGSVGAANLTACSSAIGAVHGARGGSSIPESDRRGVYNHVAKHLRDGGKEPPPFSMADVVEELTAAAHVITIPDVPPLEWFSEPVDVPPIGALTITDTGRVYGYLAPLRVAHRGFPDKRIEVPTKNVDYGGWMNRPTIVEGGNRVATGVITMDCGHSDPLPWIGPAQARDHYDNSCSVFATVRIGENKRGVWVAGALLHDVTPSQVARALACQLSGDWRPHRERTGMREFCGALLVPVPGFPMRSAQSSVRVDNRELVAAAVPVHWKHETERIDYDWDGNDAGVSDEPKKNEEELRDYAAEATELARELGLDLATTG